MLKKSIKISVLMMAILLFFNSCDDSIENTDYENYFPLKIGNKWIYSYNGNADFSREVIGKKEIEGTQYFEIFETDILEDNLGYSRFYRVEKSKLLELFQNNSLEHIIADFSLKEGEVFHQDNTGFDVTVLSDDPNEFTFFYDHPNWVDEEHTVIFAIDIGMISDCYGFGGCYTLLEYDLK